MGSGLKNKKKQKWMPSYNPSVNEIKYRNYCIRNNIRIAPKAIYQDPNNWHIEVRLGPYTKGEKGYVSPNVYDRKQIWPEYFLMCKYYYDKKNKK
jgi:hypothetical protein|tara:strand:+ start:195 stop:479 length:285 start_codon:yes stop_codon:yes gene_type:complete